MMLGMKTQTSLFQIFKVYIAEPVLITLGFHQWLWGGTGTPREGHILCTSLWGGNEMNCPPKGGTSCQCLQEEPCVTGF